MKKIILLITIVSFYQLFASTNLTHSGLMHILRVNNPQSVAMGYTGVSYSHGIFASEINPAGIANMMKYEAYYSFYPRVGGYHNSEDYNQYSCGLGFHLSSFNNVAIQFTNFILDNVSNNPIYFDYPRSDLKSSGLKEFKITISHKVQESNKNLLVGISLKNLHEYNIRYDHGIYNSSILLFDFGIQYYQYFEKNVLSFGTSIINIGDDSNINDDDIYYDPLNLVRFGFSYEWNKFLDNNTGLILSLEYQRSINDKEEMSYDITTDDIRWNHIGIGIQLKFFENLFTRIGYSMNLEDVSEYHDIKGFTYGIGFELPKKVKIIIPVIFSFSMSKGLKDYRGYENTLFTLIVKK